MSKRQSMLASIALDDGAAVSTIARSGQELLRIFCDKIVPNPDQPRKYFDETSILRLAADIRERGLLQPIRVMSPDDSGSHRIIAGERRWRAAAKAGLEVIDCVVDYDVRTADEAFDEALAENVQRQDLSRPDLAAALQRVKDRFGLTILQLAERYNMSEDWVAQHLAFGALAPEAQVAMESGRVATAVAMAVRGLAADDQPTLLEAVANLPNREAQLSRITQVKELQRQGVTLGEALAASSATQQIGIVPAPRPRGVRPAGRPPAGDDLELPFSWSGGVIDNGEAAGAILNVSFRRLAMVRRGLLMRESVVDAYVDTLLADLDALRSACASNPAGEGIWSSIRGRVDSALTAEPGVEAADDGAERRLTG